MASKTVELDVRYVVAADAEELELVEASAVTHRRWSIGDIVDCLDDNDVFGLCCVNDNDGKAIVGYALMKQRNHTTVDLLRMAVRPKYNRIGVGTELLTGVVQMTRKAGNRILATALHDVRLPRAHRLVVRGGFRMKSYEYEPDQDGWVARFELTLM